MTLSRAYQATLCTRINAACGSLGLLSLSYWWSGFGWVHHYGWMTRGIDPGYVTSISRADQSSLERRVNFSELISPTSGPVDTTNVSLYEALKSVIEWTGQVRVEGHL